MHREPFLVVLVGLLQYLLQKNIAVSSRTFSLPEVSGRERSTIMFALQVGAKSKNMTGGACTSLLQRKSQLLVS